MFSRRTHRKLWAYIFKTTLSCPRSLVLLLEHRASGATLKCGLAHRSSRLPSNRWDGKIALTSCVFLIGEGKNDYSGEERTLGSSVTRPSRAFSSRNAGKELLTSLQMNYADRKANESVITNLITLEME